MLGTNDQIIPFSTRDVVSTSYSRDDTLQLIVQQKLIQIWEDLLNVHPIAIHDNFFALGGDSLLAIQVNTRLSAVFQIDLPLRGFFGASTIAELTALVLQEQASRQAVGIQPAFQPSSGRTDTTRVFPTTSAQQALWFLDQLEAGTTAHNLSVTVLIHKPVHTEVLKQSLAALVQRHDALRTTFSIVDRQLVQQVAPHMDIPITIKNLQHLSLSERNATLEHLMAQELQHPFDLDHGPLLDICLFHLSAEENILLLIMHHSISDGWSVNLLLQEFVTLYEAFSTVPFPHKDMNLPAPSCENDATLLPALPLQFGDFALWQHEWLASERFQEELSYWKQHLAGASTTLALPTDHPHPTLPTSQSALHTFGLTPELSQALKALSRQEHVTLYMTLVAAFLILLQRYSAQDDLLLGTTMAGRTFPETQSVSGYFINTVVLRTDLSGNPTVHDLLGKVRAVVLAAEAHQYVPFDVLVGELQLDHAQGQCPLFQVFLTLNPPLTKLPTGYNLTQLKHTTGATSFNLSLELADNPTGIVGNLEYRTDLFDACTIARMAGHWETLLQAMVDDPTQSLSTLPLLTSAERQQLLCEWNATSVARSQTLTLVQLLETQAERTPTRTAVIFAGSELTYQELNARSNQFAHYLQSCGVKPDVIVGICVKRSLDMIVALLGILKAGGAYLPLDPSYPAERIAFMLDDARVSVLVIQQKLLDTGIINTNTTESETRIVCMDTDRERFHHLSEANLATPIMPSHLAYVIYTSGSTGRPKGAQISHHALVNLLQFMRQEPGITPQDTLLAVTTLSFDMAVTEIFLPLTTGARLAIASRDVITNGVALAETLAQTQATVMQVTPITWRLLLSTGWQANSSMKIICGGEALPLELARQLMAHGASVHNIYGPTETTVFSTQCKIEPTTTAITIGRPIANTTIYILDQHLQLVPIGVPGELYIGGDGLARGYLNRPELTAERFIRHPFNTEPAARLYRTGDMARYRNDGTIELLGRVDHQVKLRGFRIELGEIEAILEQHPAVRQAVALVREDHPGDKRLVAYFQLHVGQQSPTYELRQHASAHLPNYMVPSLFVVLDRLPQTLNGKVDRHALPSPDETREMEPESYVAPQLMVHHQLVQIWEELLNMRPIGIRDNFFDLGGHSLLAIRLVTQIEQVCGKKLALATLFEDATIEHLATALLVEKQESGTRISITPLNANGTQTPFFFLHGDWQGKARYCLQLSQMLGQEQPFYILETYKYADLEELPTFKEIAAAYSAAIRTIYPEGPYILGGWCNGALFAYEMAQQLQAEGQEVEQLILMDPGTPATMSLLLSKAMRWLGSLLHVSEERQVNIFLLLLHLYEYVRLWNERKEQAAIQRRTEREGTPAEVEMPHPNFQWIWPTREKLRQNYISIFGWWVSPHTIEPYEGKIAVFWTEDNARERKIWQRLLAGKQDVEVYIVPGTHITSRTKYAESLGESLRACLHEVGSERLLEED